MATVAEARAIGLPVYVSCRACSAPSRVLALGALDPCLDLDAAASAGRFRCSGCGQRTGVIMPTVSALLVKANRLRMVCIPCGRDQAITAADACERFGLDTPFDVLRARLKCRPDCAMTAGAMSMREEVSPSGGRVLAPRAKKP
ncbi:MAG: hypothetical protein WDM92_06260 [Caulobacteraceae bacterium]